MSGNPAEAAHRPETPEHGPQTAAGKGPDSYRKRAIRAYLSSNRPAIGRLVQGEFEIHTLAEAERLATMLASHCPDAENAAMGIWELLCNAIEHGNYGIDCATKARLLGEGALQDELERRAAMSPYRDRIVRVHFRQSSIRIEIRIEDEGDGFDHARYDGDLAPGASPNGRGIALARALAFSSLIYPGSGNLVIATIRRDKTR